ASSTVHCTSRPAGRLLQYSKTWNHASDYFGVRIGPATVRVRRVDGYFDATAICQAYGARWWDFGRTSRAQAVIMRIAERNGIPETATISADDATAVQKCTAVDATVVQKCTAVVESYEGVTAGNSRGAGQGTWIHPDLVLVLVDWCVPGTVVDAAGWLPKLWAAQAAAVVPVRSRPGRRSPRRRSHNWRPPSRSYRWVSAEAESADGVDCGPPNGFPAPATATTR
ncbi:MAG: KilA-N protein, partial [Gemmataceae bacterium]|nr:KilA-N protein [Gemmataceae bacterium]